MPRICPNAPGLDVVHLGVILRLHHRHQYIERIFNMLRKLSPRGKLTEFHITISVGVDRPTAHVICELNRSMRRAWKRGKVYHHASIPVVSDAGANWMVPLRNLHQAHLADCLDHTGTPPDAILFLEDDQLLTSEGLRELRGHLSFLEYDRLDVQSLFCWDSEGQYNSRPIAHWGTLLWRHYPGDEFPLNRVIRAPASVHASSRSLNLTHPIKDFGWLTAEERERAWLANKAAGRIDRFTLTLTQKPILKPWPSPDQTR